MSAAFDLGRPGGAPTLVVVDGAVTDGLHGLLADALVGRAATLASPVIVSR